MEKVRELTQGGVDFAFEAIGLATTVEQAIECVRPGGKAVIVGMTAMGQKLAIDAYQLVAQQKTLMGISYGNARQRIASPRMVELYLSGKLDLDRLVTHRYRLEEINEGFARMEKGETARGVVIF